MYKLEYMIGNFVTVGYKYKKDDGEVVKSDYYRKVQISSQDKSKYGTVLRMEFFEDGKLLDEFKLGHIKTLYDTNGKELTKYLEFIEGKSKNVESWYVTKRERSGKVLEYEWQLYELGKNSSVNMMKAMRIE